MPIPNIFFRRILWASRARDCALEERARKGEDNVTVTEAMTYVPFFSDLTDQERELVRLLCSVREGQAGDHLMIEGAPVDHILFLLSGKVMIYKKDKNGEEKAIASLGQGFFYGELSFLDNGPASATVKAGLPYQAVAINQEALHELLESQPRLGYKIIKAFARLTSLRLREADDMLAGFPGALRDLTIARAYSSMPGQERKSGAE